MNKVRFWLQNARPISLPQSLLPAFTALALSYGAPEFNWIAAIACVAGVAFLHLSLNLLDDWFDYREGSAEARHIVSVIGLALAVVIYIILSPLGIAA